MRAREGDDVAEKAEASEIAAFMSERDRLFFGGKGEWFD